MKTKKTKKTKKTRTGMSESLIKLVAASKKRGTDVVFTSYEMVPVEDDGDEIFLPIPKKCIIWSCNEAKVKKNHKGFMCCTNCGCSYGKAK